ncbi:hypothetical protein PEP31012_04636 [Pandoraea eparura]|uniref:Uncharacterized protein n=1 Tax=Pandoraea eparura TaxID=2508291 RepID=A0A5E4YP54_9BURK|nr:hypothetical protein PEP31012_04636 [Pandoraea eparura]
MSVALELVEAFSVLSEVHPGESVYVCIRKDLAFRPSCRLNGPYWVDLHVGSSYRLAKSYAGLSLGAANEVALRYLLKHVDGIGPWLH